MCHYFVFETTDYEDLAFSVKLSEATVLNYHLVPDYVKRDEINSILQSYVWNLQLRRATHFVVMCNVNCTKDILERVKYFTLFFFFSDGSTLGLLFH